MAKYRMDIFKPGRKPGHPAPLLWRRRDIDAAAKAEAEYLYRNYASQRSLTNFLPLRQRRQVDLRVRGEPVMQG